MKKKALFKDICKEIYKTRNRFLSIFAIVALGTGFFAGLKVTCPNMIENAQKYYATSNLMDIQLKSTMGFDDKDFSALAASPGIRNIQGAYSYDAFIKGNDDADRIMRTMSINLDEYKNSDYITKPKIIEGKMPKNETECVVDFNGIDTKTYPIGSTISFYSDDDSIDDALKHKEFTIVGYVNSPMYISYERGSANIGNGVIDGFVLIPEQAYKYEVYTDIFVTLKATENTVFSDPRYSKIVDEKISEFEKIADKREQERYLEIRDEANEKIRDAEKELENGRKDYEKGKTEFENQIASAQQKIDEGYRRLEKEQSNYNKGLKEYTEGWNQYKEGTKKLEENRPIIEKTKKELEMTASMIEGDKDSLSSILHLIENSETGYITFNEEMIQRIDNSLTAKQIMGPDFSMRLYVQNNGDTYPVDTVKIYTQNAQSALNIQQKRLNDALSAFTPQYEKFIATEKQILSAQKKLASAKDDLDKAPSAINKAKKDLKEAQSTLNRERTKGENKLREAKADIDKGQTDLDKAKEDLKSLEKPRWYVFARDTNPGYAGFVDDAHRVDKVSEVFPVFFILVAALVCLTTMTRMVEEQRTQIGTLKALGYKKSDIILKYIIYALSASLLGSIVGLSIGMNIFPLIIFNAYQMLYAMPQITPHFLWSYAIICTLVSMIATGTAAFLACYKELNTCAASLMRPKPPKMGQKVFLEKIPFIWKRLNFSYKVTVRNLIRYKKRIFLTVIGIAGCTALLVTGFGLRFAIGSIVDKQYEDISVYDVLGVYDDTVKTEQLSEIRKQVNNSPYLKDKLFIRQASVDITRDGYAKKEVYMVVPEVNDQLNTFINLQNRKTKEVLHLKDDGIIVTEKVAKLFDAKIGDEIEVYLKDNLPVTAKITGITEHYALNYIYISPALYRQLTGESVKLNGFLGNMYNPKDDDTHLSTELLQNENILALSYTLSSGKLFHDMVGSLNYIVLLIIVSAGLLAFVVLYNLANINVTERIREIATIKVLGFTDKEVSKYINRENTISAFFGMIAGLFLGIPLEKFIVKTAEIDIVMFNPNIHYTCFIFAALLTIGFTLIVNMALHKTLRKVSMVESMKSIE